MRRRSLGPTDTGQSVLHFSRCSQDTATQPTCQKPPMILGMQRYTPAIARIIALRTQHFSRVSRSLRPHILDLGSGTREFTNKLAALVPQGLVLGVDASRSQIEYARGRRQTMSNSFWAASRHSTHCWSTVNSTRRYRAPRCIGWNQADHPSLLRTVAAHLRPGGYHACRIRRVRPDGKRHCNTR